jgi:putative DNA primase/helicase
MENYAKLAFNCNELPKDFDHSNAYFRRLLIVPFRVTIPEAEQDKTLANKIIRMELAGVFNWIIEGLRRLLKTEKFTESNIVKETLEAYKRESDSVACFVDEQPDIVRLSLKIAYADYRSYCLDCGFKPLGRNNFAKRLQIQGFLLETMRNGVIITHKGGEK